MDEACDDGIEVVLEVQGVRLERDSGCLRWLQWSCHIAGFTPQELADALKAAGCPDTSRLPGLHEFELPDRHRLVVVPKTERVQLRLDIGVPRDLRPEVALKVARLVATTCARRPR